MEYTLVAVLGVVVVWVLDTWVLRLRVLASFRYWIFFVFASGFFLMMNSYLTCRPIVSYGENYYLGFRIGCIPVEDFLFHFALTGLTILLWESRQRRSQ